MIATVDICGKRILEYVADCLGKFNQRCNPVKIRAFGGNIAKAFRVAQILKNEFQGMVSIDKTDVYSVALDFEIEDSKVLLSNCTQEGKESLLSQKEGMLKELMVELDLKLKNLIINKKEQPDAFYISGNYIGFPIYHLLIDNLLTKFPKINVSKFTYKRSNSDDGFAKFLTLAIDEEKEIICSPTVNRINNQNFDKDELYKNLNTVYYRSGLFMAENWKDVTKKISEFDDIIIGVDTNILLTTSLSEQLLATLNLLDPIEYIHTPNWMLIVIPNAVMHEIEKWTNSRVNNYLTTRGRIGFRALQEILEVGQSADIHGTSLLIFGEAMPALSNVDEIKSLRREIQNLGQHLLHLGDSLEYFTKKLHPQKDISDRRYRIQNPSRDSSSGDTPVRDQFKHFLRQLNFYRGGMFFLTSDKTNAALAQAEGLFSIYYKMSNWKNARNNVKLSQEKCRVYRLDGEVGESFKLSVPIGKLIYELAVQFGKIKIDWGDKNKYVVISCDVLGESLDHWIYRDLIIDENSLKNLYDLYGDNISLEKVKDVWQNVCDKLIKTKCI